jgi:hypothetical protein
MGGRVPSCTGPRASHGTRHDVPTLEPMTPPVATTSAPVLGLAQAAKACGVSESTIRRKRPELLAAGATQDSRGWRIPVPALIQLGLMDRTTAPDAPDSPPVAAQEAVTTPATQTPMEPLLEALREKLAAAEQRAAVAEAIAEERERIIAVQAQALRMLEAPKWTAPGTAQEVATPATGERAGDVTAAQPAPVQEQPNRLRRLLHRALR